MTGDLPTPPREADAQHERFAELIRTERATILAAYASSLQDFARPIVTDTWSHEQAMRDAAEIIADVAAIVEGNDTRPEDPGKTLPLLTGTHKPAAVATPRICCGSRASCSR